LQSGGVAAPAETPRVVSKNPGAYRKRSVKGQLSRRLAAADGLPVPGQEFGDAPGGMVGDAGEHVGKVVLRVKTVEVGALDQRVDRRSPTATGIGAGEQVILAADGNAAQGLRCGGCRKTGPALARGAVRRIPRSGFA
jgi:hypothetical protein